MDKRYLKNALPWGVGPADRCSKRRRSARSSCLRRRHRSRPSRRRLKASCICAPGASGEKVRQLQEALRRAGYFVYVDGNYGAATRKAVAEFQRKTGHQGGRVRGRPDPRHPHQGIPARKRRRVVEAREDAKLDALGDADLGRHHANASCGRVRSVDRARSLMPPMCKKPAVRQLKVGALSGTVTATLPDERFHLSRPDIGRGIQRRSGALLELRSRPPARR